MKKSKINLLISAILLTSSAIADDSYPHKPHAESAKETLIETLDKGVSENIHSNVVKALEALENEKPNEEMAKMELYKALENTKNGGIYHQLRKAITILEDPNPSVEHNQMTENNTSAEANNANEWKSFAELIGDLKPSVVSIEAIEKTGISYSSEQQQFSHNPFDMPFFDKNIPDINNFGDYLMHNGFKNNNNQWVRENTKHLNRKKIGSGVISSNNGIIITSESLIENTDSVFVHFDEENKFKARVLTVDPETNLAIIKIDNINTRPAPISFKEPFVADDVLTLGADKTMGSVAAKGIVMAKSNKNSPMPFFRVDSKVFNTVNGAPVFSQQGKMIGIQVHFDGNLNFVVPSQIIDYTIQKFEKQKQQHSAAVKQHKPKNKPKLGVFIDESETHFENNKSGALITKVIPNSPADLAGILPGDIITQFNNHTITSGLKLIEVVKNCKKKKFTINLIRNNKNTTIQGNFFYDKKSL